MTDRPAGVRPKVTVVTVTCDRPVELRRAIASVAAQEDVDVEHVLVGDECAHLGDPRARAELAEAFPQLVVRNVPRPRHGAAETQYLPSRLSQLRNLGVALSSAPYVAQLDDDNAFDPDHLGSLVALLDERPEAEVAYSWRRLLDQDGRAFIPAGVDPWEPNERRRASSYRRLCRFGILTPGSSIVRDALERDGRLIARVDTSEYLVRRELHRRVPWPLEFSPTRQRLGFTEDVAFSHALVKARVVTVCSERATLRYFMGGYSNAPTAGDDA